VIAFLGMILLFSSSAVAEKRVALVIGNSAYLHTVTLTNPKNDAADMVAALKKRGFVVIEGFDLNKAAFDSKVLEFAATLRGADAGVFYYAGHGLQVAGQNYLVPIDAKAEAAETLEFEMLRVDVVHRIMERLTNTNILFLDACRDNPLTRNLARSMGTRSSEIGHGLAQVEAGVGTLISFSTQPGNVALDGTGRNSPFASALVREVSSSNDDLSAILIAVRNDVMRETQRKQIPWEHSALTGRFYFNQPAQTAPAAALSHPESSEPERAWTAARDTTSIPVLEDFVARYKDSFYAGLARARLEELRKVDDNQKIADFTKAIESSPNVAFAYANRGRVYFYRKDYDRAIPDFTQVINLEPKNSFAYHFRGLSYHRKSDFDRAISDFTKAIDLNPKDQFAYNNRGNAYYGKLDYGRAIADFDQAINLDPLFPAPFTARGIAYEATGRRDLALRDYQAALALPEKYEDGKWAHEAARAHLSWLKP